MANQRFFQNDVDATKKIDFNCDAVATATTRTITMPNRSGTLFEASSIAIDGTAITNLAATDVKAALAELQGDIDGLTSIQGQYAGSAATMAAVNALTAQAGDWAILTADDGGNQAGVYVRGGATFSLVAQIPEVTLAMTGATAVAAGSAGLVPAPAAGSQASFLRGDGTWAAIPAAAAASDTVAGIIELATTAEALAMTATDRALTPASVAGRLMTGTAPDWTVTNPGLSRTFDANNVTQQQVAQAVALLLNDLISRGSLS